MSQLSAATWQHSWRVTEQLGWPADCCGGTLFLLLLLPVCAATCSALLVRLGKDEESGADVSGDVVGDVAKDPDAETYVYFQP
jgi:hypothetical protein